PPQSTRTGPGTARRRRPGVRRRGALPVLDPARRAGRRLPPSGAGGFLGRHDGHRAHVEGGRGSPRRDPAAAPADVPDCLVVLRTSDFVLLCCWVGMIPMSPAALIPLPLAIWPFVKLLRSDLKFAFEGKGTESAAPPPGPRLSVWRRLGSLARSLPYYFLPSR